MPDSHLHIVSFDIPFPPDYGGIIDVYYKLKALHQAGTKVHLHCFQYNRDQSPILEELCDSVNYYPRLTGLRSAISHLPYIVKSRKSADLLANLLKDSHPIIFEGIHSCYLLNHPKLKERYKVYRESNIEHHYYYSLAKAEQIILRKLYFGIEAFKLRLFQPTLRHAQLMLAVSRSDTDYLKTKFPDNNVQHLPSFHANNDVMIREGLGTYALYHGNLSVPENLFAAKFLIKEVFADLPHQLIIAGLNPPEGLISLAKQYSHIQLIANPDNAKMSDLIRNAQLNVLTSFQATGLKLKLLNTLFNGRHVLVNTSMVAGTDLGSLCHIANDAAALRVQVNRLMTVPFEPALIEPRKYLLGDQYSNELNVSRLHELIAKNI